MEDVALSARLKRIGRPACLAERVVTSGRRWEGRGVLRTIVLMWRLRLAYWLGADPVEARAPVSPADVNGTLVIVFARAPLPGRTKTRLIPALGAAGAARLQARLTRRALDTARAARPARVELHGAGRVRNLRVPQRGNAARSRRAHASLARSRFAEVCARGADRIGLPGAARA